MITAVTVPSVYVVSEDARFGTVARNAIAMQTWAHTVRPLLVEHWWQNVQTAGRKEPDSRLPTMGAAIHGRFGIPLAKESKPVEYLVPETINGAPDQPQDVDRFLRAP